MMRRPFIVAEMSASHLGSLARAHAIIEAAAHAGADAIKVQAFTPEQMVDADRMIETGPWAGRLAIDLYREALTPREWFPELFQHAAEVALVAFASVFHPDDVDFLETLGCPTYKIASFELTDTALIAHAARTGKPLIISTGMATADEIAIAMRVAHSSGCRDITMLKCTSAYPATETEANLRTILHMLAWLSASSKHHPEDWTKWAVGLSDHTIGHTCAVVATALGATVIEKHLTLRRKDGGPDATFSMEPEEFAKMVTECRIAAASVGNVQYGPTPGEAAQMLLRRKPGGKRGD